jgi:hypothetical protein
MCLVRLPRKLSTLSEALHEAPDDCFRPNPAASSDPGDSPTRAETDAPVAASPRRSDRWANETARDWLTGSIRRFRAVAVVDRLMRRETRYPREPGLSTAAVGMPVPTPKQGQPTPLRCPRSLRTPATPAGGACLCSIETFSIVIHDAPASPSAGGYLSSPRLGCSISSALADRSPVEVSRHAVRRALALAWGARAASAALRGSC